MQFFSTIFAAVALATVVSANSIHFVSQDSTDRTIYFTANEGDEAIPELTVAGLSTANQTFPYGWTGNFYSVSAGQDVKIGMLGEIDFDAYDGATFYDVSAIVDATDDDGVKTLFPLISLLPVAGCEASICTDTETYYVPDDDATKSSDESDFVCTLGSISTKRRRGAVAERRASAKAAS